MKKYVRPEKQNKLSNRAARLVRKFSSTILWMPALSCAAKLGSHSWSTVIKYKSIELTRPPQPYYNEQALFNKEMGRSDVHLRALPSCTLVTCSYTSTWDQCWKQAQITQTFQLPPFCKQHSVTAPMPLQGVICNGFSSFSGTFHSRTWVIPP